MNVLAKETISIDRPAALIFDYVSNMENFGRWFQGVIGMEITITECGLSSQFEWKMYSRNHGILFRALLLPLIRSEITKRAQKSLPRLKAVLVQKTS